VKSRVHGVLHGVDVPAREEPREVPRLLARFPCVLSTTPLRMLFYDIGTVCQCDPVEGRCSSVAIAAPAMEPPVVH
jgi:hypothetical protein